MSELTIRPAFPDDAVALGILAVLDSSSVPPGALLIGEIDGVLAAAFSISQRSAIADPFRRTTELLELLARRAGQLRGDTSEALLTAALRTLLRRARRRAFGSVTADGAGDRRPCLGKTPST